MSFYKLNYKTSAQVNEFKQAFSSTFIEIAETIPDTPTIDFINSVKTAIPHLTEVVENLTDALSDKNLPWAFTGLARFYEGQGLYALAEPWYQQCLSAVTSRLGENHPDVATSLNNLAQLYSSQGKYEAAEPLFLQALELHKQLLGEQHPDMATSLNNLALFINLREGTKQAEPLFLQALEFYKQLLGEQHPHVAISFNNLASTLQISGKVRCKLNLFISSTRV